MDVLDELPGFEPSEPMRSERLELRPFTREELEAAAEGASAETFAPGFPTPEARDWAQSAMSAGEHFFTESEYGLRAVVELSSGLVIGGAGFVGPAIENELEVEGSVVPSHRRRGFGAEALRALVARARENPRVRAVHGSVPTGPHPARQVLLRCGFTPRPSGGTEDSYVLSLR